APAERESVPVAEATTARAAMSLPRGRTVRAARARSAMPTCRRACCQSTARRPTSLRRASRRCRPGDWPGRRFFWSASARSGCRGAGAAPPEPWDPRTLEPWDPVLGPEALQHARERDRLAQVVEPADPCDEAFDPHAEAGVRHRAVAAEVEVPLEGFARQLMLGDLSLERREVVLALSAADDLAVSLGREHVDAERDARIRGVGLH